MTTAPPPDLPQVEPIARETLQDHVHRMLTDLILDGAIAPGELVTIQRLADAFGTSAMPVREALKRLTAANVLTVVSGRSIGIPPLSIERLTDLRRVRREIEPLAAGWAVGRLTPQDTANLRQHLKDMRKAIAVNDVKAFLRSNRAFHFGLYAAAGSPTMDAIVEALWLQISPYFHLLGRSGTLLVNNAEHEAMFAAIVKGDVAATQACLRHDIDIGCEAIEKLLS